MKKHLTYLPLIALFFAGCTEIFSPDISGASITVQSPGDSLHTAESVISFWWEPNSEVEQYQLRITRGGGGNVQLVTDTVFLETSIAYEFSQEGVYNWQLRGVNAGTESPWQARGFILDFGAPEKASALSFDGDTLASGATGTLAWTSADQPLDNLILPVTDSLRIYRRNDSTTIGASMFYDEGAARQLDFSASGPAPFNGPGDYQWEVVTVDRAGNRNTSPRFQLTID